MKRQIGKMIMMAILVIAGLAIHAPAQEQEQQPAQQDLQGSREALEGIKGVRVKVEGLEMDAEAKGLIALELQKDIELTLRQNQITVLNQDATYFSPVDSYLIISVSLVKQKLWTYAYAISVQVRQPAKLNNGKTVYAGTWQRGEVGMKSSRKIAELKESIMELVSFFVNDYLAANPK
jgi:hypothetical protein